MQLCIVHENHTKQLAIQYAFMWDKKSSMNNCKAIFIKTFNKIAPKHSQNPANMPKYY